MRGHRFRFGQMRVVVHPHFRAEPAEGGRRGADANTGPATRITLPLNSSNMLYLWLETAG
jgi:hypothetical protein